MSSDIVMPPDGFDSARKVQLMDITQVYLFGFLVAGALSLIWSLVLDSNKPPTLSELFLKLLARCLLLTFLVAVIIGFLYLAIGLFRS